MLNIRNHISLNQKVPLKMSFTSKRTHKAQQIFVAETIIMLLKYVKPSTLNQFNQANGKVLLVSLFLCQISIQYSHGSHVQMPISVVPTAQNLLQQFPQQQQIASISPLESIYPTVNFYYSRSTFSPDQANNYNSESSFLKGQKLDPERHSTIKPVNQVDEVMQDSKTTPSIEQQNEIFSHDGTTEGEINNQPTTVVADVQIADFTRNDDLSSPDDDSITTKVHFFSSKNKRQALHSQKGPDWWSQMSSSNNKHHSSTKTSQPNATFDGKSNPNQLENRQEKVSRKKPQSRNNNNNNNHHNQHHQPPPVKGRGVFVSKKGSTNMNDAHETNPRNVYKEQPINQNAILTLKNQLNAIRSKHKYLMTTSVNQLQQLDNKLIESYKLCFKKKMPLYAGMLYRTRDFVVRMARDVKHESNVLEAMTKQVQSVLRQRMSNKTLVREYNQIVATSTEANISQQQLHTTSLESIQIQSDQQSIKVVSTNRISSSSSSSGSLTKFKKESPFEPSDIPYHVQDNTISQTFAETSQTNKKIRPGGKPQSPVASKSSSVDLSGVKNNFQGHEIKNLTTKRPKLKYTVSVNEVNLKKELNKIQALIDRVNGSTYELSAVVDDIVHLFKLTSDKKSYSFFSKTNKIDKTHNQAHTDDSNGPQQQQNDITATTTYDHQQMASNKKNKKMLKSPIRVFLEKYGKLTMANFEMPNGNNNSTMTTSDSENSTNALNQPDFKPLFDSRSFNYFESSSSSLDADTGFDYISTENE